MMQNQEDNELNAKESCAAYSANCPEKQRDDALIRTIQVLDLLITQANMHQLGTISRILHNAREDLVYWAVELNFHETAMEKFVNSLLYNNSYFTTSHFIEKMALSQTKEEMLESLLNAKLELPSLSLSEKL